MTGMGHTQNAIFFRKNISKEDIEKEAGNTADCFISRDIVMEANSVNQIEFDTEVDVKGGTLIGSSELAKKGIMVLKSKVRGKKGSCWVHNVSGAPVELKRNSVVAQVREPVQRSVAVWAVHVPDNVD